MSKIRDIRIDFGDKVIRLDMKYSASQECFFVMLPMEFNIFQSLETTKHFFTAFRLSGRVFHAIAGDTEEATIKKVKEFGSIYRQAIAKQRKVILYKIDYHSKNVNGNNCHYQDGGKADIEFWYGVFTEYSEGETKKYLGDTEREEFDNYDIGRYNYIVIDYTEEAERFMKDLYEAMDTLMKRIGEFIGSAESATKAIESRMKLLPTMTEKE